jgi:lipopolysaccharide transport system ATP-binding protein
MEVNGIGKRYRIGVREAQPDTFRELVGSLVMSPFSYLRQMWRPPSEAETLWALKDVSFKIQQGEAVGIVGRNGAGKSTLLKVLSRIMDPTTGRAVIRGRVGSLLEVGTGFHPDLTGRENTYLNGALLGMRKGEIDRKFDEIMAFSGVERFVDTPVKRYSSGMYVRLAFGIAAHLEPEILIVDEVLAVGDLAFQKKCLEKMNELTKIGRTVLFVSHSMLAIRTLCPRTILMEAGQVVTDGPTTDTIIAYYDQMRQMSIDAHTAVGDAEHRRGSGAVRFTAVRTEDENGRACTDFQMGSTVRFVLSYEVFEPVADMHVSVALRSGKTREVTTSARYVVSERRLEQGHTGTVVIEFPEANVRPGEYPLYYWLGNRLSQPYDVVDDLTIPLMFSTNKDFEELGYDPTVQVGFYSIASRRLQ